jgi:CheY-like chemotaxis protein
MKKAERILVVDDEESIRSTLGEYFTDIGYEVVAAESGASLTVSSPTCPCRQ